MNSINDQRNTIINLLLLMLTSVIAPLLSHFLDMYLGAETNTWKTDKLLLLYFSGVAGYIISNKVLREWSKTKLYKKGFKLGNADALTNILWMTPITIVIVCYESVIGALIIIALISLAIVILWRDIDNIVITPGISLVAGIFVALIVVVFTVVPYEGSEIEWILYLSAIFITQILICLIVDMLTIARIKMREKKGK